MARDGGVLKTETVNPIKLNIKQINGQRLERWCHYWNISSTDIDLFEVKDGRIEQVAAIGNIESIEEVTNI